VNRIWERHDETWRDPAQIVSHWQDAGSVDPSVLRFRTYGGWWDALATRDITLIVSREYEHLLMGLSVEDGRPSISFMPMPHPSGVVADRRRGVVHVASTRNPNQVFDLVPVRGLRPRGDVRSDSPGARPLVPIRTRFFPGSLYMHDLALVGGALHANAVGENAVIRLNDDGTYRRVWWPRCIERPDGPLFGRNHLQLNSIAAGPRINGSFFSASTDQVSARRPGHRNFPVDGRGVIFSGRTREPIVRGLTRPHSARLLGNTLWVANSGYGELAVYMDGRAETVRRLPGWTRGLTFHHRVAFVGTSRVISRFRQYAPGLDVDSSRCGVHAVDTRSGEILGGIEWPAGNQVFGIDWVPREQAAGFVFTARNRRSDWPRKLFYAFSTRGNRGS
jgi:uncharacterized protein (TIGR03032 family)